MFTILKNTVLLKIIPLVALISATWLPLSHAEVTLESETKIADNALHFDGVRVERGAPDNGTEKYDYYFGRTISAHGDSVKTYKHFVFMTWYKGGKFNRNVMLSRYNRNTGVIKTIEFPHQHTGLWGVKTIGESHNTIGLSVSPINGTIHMVYDMHGYSDSNLGRIFKDDFFRYSFSIAGAADVADDDFSIDKFVKDTSTISQGDDDYKHVTMTGELADKDNFENLTYPKFFTTKEGTLLLYMRKGGATNGAYVFNRYDAENEKWSTFVDFSKNNQLDKGNPYNWGLYGNMKYVNGKLRVGFQQRTAITDDKYLYQNGIFYAYSDHPEGFGDWYNAKGQSMTWPLINSDEIKIFEPGDLVETTLTDKVYIVGGFDWTETARGDLHFIHQVKDNENKLTVNAHTYRPAETTEFITKTDFSGGSAIYTAGDKIYLIGLENGKPYIESAEGGTNQFTRVYQAEKGNFDHGVVHINEGKVYYYLMDKVLGADGKKTAISTSMPLYLQVIDLGLPSSAKASFVKANVELIEGYDNISLTLEISDIAPLLEVVSAELYINEQLISSLDSEPYQWTQANSALSALSAGEHSAKAKVTMSNGEKINALTSITVLDPTPNVNFNQTAMSVIEGYDKLSLTVDVTSPIARDIEKVTLFINNIEVSQDVTAPYQWNQTSTLLQGISVGSHTIKAVATDIKGKTAEQTMTLNVTAKPVVETPVVDVPKASSSNSSGGGTSTPLLLILLTLFTLARRYYAVADVLSALKKSA